MQESTKITFEEHTTGKSFITDLGFNQEFVDPEKMAAVELGRYGVWLPDPENSKHKVIEIGNNIKELQEKYGIEDELVLTINYPEKL